MTNTYEMLALGGKDNTRESIEILVSVEAGKIIRAEGGEELKILGETNLMGWGEKLNGPAYEVGFDYGFGDGVEAQFAVPVREWERIASGKHTRS